MGWSWVKCDVVLLRGTRGESAASPAHWEDVAVVTDYRLAPALAARLMGIGLMLVAVLVFSLSILAAVFELPLQYLVVVAAVGLLLAAGSAWWLMRNAVVFRASEDGYRVRFVRGAGAHEARWAEVEDAVTMHIRDTPCLVLRLRDGRTTTIPVEALAIDREQFVREVQDHLQRGHGLPPLKRRRRS